MGGGGYSPGPTRIPLSHVRGRARRWANETRSVWCIGRTPDRTRPILRQHTWVSPKRVDSLSLSLSLSYKDTGANNTTVAVMSTVVVMSLWSAYAHVNNLPHQRPRRHRRQNAPVGMGWGTYNISLTAPPPPYWLGWQKWGHFCSAPVKTKAWGGDAETRKWICAETTFVDTYTTQWKALKIERICATRILNIIS